MCQAKIVSRQFCLYDTLATVLWDPELEHFQSRSVEQRPPLALRPLLPGVHGHHLDVEAGREQRTALVGQDELVEQELGVALLHGGHRLREDLEAHVVGPVVHDEVEEVYSGACSQESE